MEEKQKRSIKQKLVRQDRGSKKNQWGMTPQQIRKAFNKKAATDAPREKKRLVQRQPPLMRPVKAQRYAAPYKKPKLLLETPVVTSQLYAVYRTPSWFENTEKAEVSVIVPLYKSASVVRDLIKSWDIQNDGIRVEVIYVDDCCPHNSKDAVIAQWITRKDELSKPVGKILYSPENQGFGVACNIGARNATGDYLIFLNADTLVTPGWIRPIIRQLKKEDVGIVGNLQLKKKGDREIIDSGGSEWSWADSSFLHIGRDCYDGKRLQNSFYSNNCPKDLFELGEREMVTGACFGIRRSLFNEIGGFNPNYRIAYWEDSEICMVLREKGYKILYQPNSRIYHQGQHSNSGGHRFHEHNRSYFLNKWVNSGRIDRLVKDRRDYPPEVRSIVIRRQAAHGDVLVAAAVTPALKKMYPQAKIMFSTLCPEVLEGNPYIDKVIDERELSERSFQLYYNLDMAYEYRPRTNILDAYADVVGVSPKDCQLFLKTAPVQGLPDDYIVLHAGRTNWVGRDWSALKFDVLSNKLQKLGHKIVCVGTARDNRISCDLDLRGKTGIPQLAYVIQKAKMFVGIDSFPMHVAQTFQTPGVCFFGSIAPETRLLQNNMIPIVAEGLRCLGCHHRQLPPCTVTSTCETQFLDCVNQVSVDQTMRKIETVLNGQA